jgi:hypothetical protein
MAKPEQAPVAELKLDKELLRGSVVHTNVGQEVMVTTGDKLRLCLRDHADALRSKTEWQTPAGMFIAFVATLVASDFKKFLELSADFWRAIFTGGAVLSGFWLLRSLCRLLKYRNRDIESIIRQLKEHSPVE